MAAVLGVKLAQKAAKPRTVAAVGQRQVEFLVRDFDLFVIVGRHSLLQHRGA